MASELLKTFQKIDDSRKVMIERARLLGHNINDNASFIELAGTITPAPEVTGYPVTSTWDRPKEWPDAKKMIREGEERDGMVPGAYIMIKSDADTFVIPNVIETMSNSTSVCMIGADGYLLSDGTWYNDATENITHTWDKSKDIIIEDGEYAGTYRWLLCYYNPSNSAKGYSFLLQFMSVVELIIGYIPRANSDSYLLNTPSLLVSQSSGGYQSLVNLEVLPESNFRGNYWSYGMSWVFARDLYEARNLDFGPTTSLGCTSAGSFFSNCKKLKHFNAPNLTTLNGNSNGINSTLNFTPAVNLETVVYGGSRTVLIGKPPYNITKLHAPNTEVAFVGPTLIEQYPLYLRNDIDLNVKYIAGGNIPYNWTTLNNNKICPGMPNTIANITETSGSYFICQGHPNLISIDLTGAMLHAYSKVSYAGENFMHIGNYSPKLREIIIEPNFEYRLDLTYTDLTHSCLVNLLTNLKDISSETYAYKTMKLGSTNIAKLTEDELKIATDKGWVIKE